MNKSTKEIVYAESEAGVSGASAKFGVSACHRERSATRRVVCETELGRPALAGVKNDKALDNVEG